MKKTNPDAKFKIDQRVIAQDGTSYSKAKIKSMKFRSPSSVCEKSDDISNIHNTDPNNHRSDSSSNFLESSAPFVSSLLSEFSANAGNSTLGCTQQPPSQISMKRQQQQEQSLGWNYFVHYFGWNARYRQWVSEDNILEENASTLQLLEVAYSGSGQINLRQGVGGKSKVGKTKNSSTSSITDQSTVSTEEESTLKEVKTEDNHIKVVSKILPDEAADGSNHIMTDTSEDKQPDKTINNEHNDNDSILPTRPKYEQYQFTTLPHDLKNILIKERSYIMSKHKVNSTFSSCQSKKRKREECVVHALPSQITIACALEEFLVYVTENKHDTHLDNSEKSSVSLSTSTATKSEELNSNWNDFTHQIKLLLNKSLSKLLLYPTEQKQFSILIKQKPNTSLCEICGCEFLLRLFIRLDILMKYMDFLKKDEEFVRYELFCLVQFLDKFSEKYFLQDYRVTIFDNGVL